MYHILAVNKETGLKITRQLTNPADYLKPDAVNLCKNLAWDGKLHCIPQRVLVDTVGRKYEVYARTGEPRTIDDVLRSAGRMFLSQAIVVKDSLTGRVICNEEPSKVPPSIRKLKYSTVYRCAGIYYFTVGD